MLGRGVRFDVLTSACVWCDGVQFLHGQGWRGECITNHSGSSTEYKDWGSVVMREPTDMLVSSFCPSSTSTALPRGKKSAVRWRMSVGSLQQETSCALLSFICQLLCIPPPQNRTRSSRSLVIHEIRHSFVCYCAPVWSLFHEVNI
jgi:hypothetical protein